MSDETQYSNAIAIVAMAGRFPGAGTLPELWAMMSAGRNAMTEMTEAQLLEAGAKREEIAHPRYVRRATRLDDIESFDAAFFGYTQAQARYIDPQQRVFLECAWEVLESAGCDPERFPGNIGVFASASSNGYLRLLERSRDLSALERWEALIGTEKDFLATRVSYKLNLTGPSLSVQSGCSSSLAAVHSACQSLLGGECDMALAGGASIHVPQGAGYLFQDGGILSADGYCRAFDVSATGTAGGSGAVAVVLMRLEEAVQQGYPVRAIIRGSAVNNDGSRKVGFTAPSVEGQTRVICEALACADVHPSEVSMIEGHGTGTSLGDAIELAALTEAYQSPDCNHAPRALGSLKSNIGHLDAAAGVAGLVKTVLCLEHRQVVPTAHFSQPNAALESARQDFYVSTRVREWVSESGPRRAGVSSFGIGGTNVHVILEEAPDLGTTAAPEATEQLIVLSARTPASLQAAVRELAGHDCGPTPAALADAAYTLQVGRKRFSHRYFTVAASGSDLQQRLDDAQRNWNDVEPGTHDGIPVAFMFPGQGAALRGVAARLYETDALFRRELDHCAAASLRHSVADVREVLCGSARDMSVVRTGVGQPALFALEYSLARLWMSWGIQPVAMIGHSLGEYVAACLSGVLSFEDAVKLVVTRAEAMDRCPQGAMLAVGLAAAEASTLLGSELCIAAVNGPAQCVLAGPTIAVEQLSALLAKRGISHKVLSTSHAFHSCMMQPAAAVLAQAERQVAYGEPRIPYISCLTGDWLEVEQLRGGRYWSDHLLSPVRFGAGLSRLAGGGSLVLLEVGGGATLSRLARVQAKPDTWVFSGLDSERPDDRRTLLGVLGQLWRLGVSVDWERFHSGTARRRVALPTYAFQRTRCWPEAAAQAPAPRPARDQSRRPESQWLYAQEWSRSVPTWADPRLLQSAAGDWLVFSDGEVGEEIVRKLRTAGCTASIVSRGEVFARLDERHWSIDPRDTAHYKRLVAELIDTGGLPRRVVHGWALSAGATRPWDLEAEFARCQELGFLSVLNLAQALAQAQLRDVVSVTVLTCDRLGHSTLPALCQVISQEHENLPHRLIDLPDQGHSPAEGAWLEDYVDWILSDTLHRDTARVVAYRAGDRLTQSVRAVTLPPNAGRPLRTLRKEGVYLITGGLGAIGLALAEWLAREYSARLVLLSRRDSNESAARLARIESAGGLAMLAVADVSDRAQVEMVLRRAEQRFGVVNGVFHLAGALHDRSVQCPVESLTVADLEAQLKPKWGGVLALEAALRGRELDFVVLFSSNAAVLGGLGRAAYAAANNTLDAVAARLRGTQHGRWLSINWDGWRTDEQAAAVAGDAANLPATLSIGEGVRVLQSLLQQCNLPQVIVSAVDLQSRFDTWAVASPEAMSAARDTEPEETRRPQRQTVRPRTELEASILETWSDVLGVRDIGVETDFFAIGDSLAGLRVLARLRDLFEVELPLQALFRAPTVSQLAVELVTELAREHDRAVA